MSDSEAVAFFVSHAAEFARRSLPVAEAVLFLRGAVVVSRECAGADDLRRAYDALQIGDDQLELIAGSQLKLNLDGGRDGK